MNQFGYMICIIKKQRDSLREKNVNGRVLIAIRSQYMIQTLDSRVYTRGYEYGCNKKSSLTEVKAFNLKEKHIKKTQQLVYDQSLDGY